MRKYAILLTAVALLFALTGCFSAIDYTLPQNPTEFITETFVNPDDSEDTYASFEYNGRTYIPYGTLKNRISGNDIGQCLGYIVQDGEKLTDARVFTLKDDTGNNFLAVLTYEGFMDPPFFYRAVDTVGKDIAIPKIVDSLGYDFWKDGNN
ncbi:MAG: hypothetical protein J5816_02780 [Clostridia bacterium]|nr:hypothetical protein [Clostridia bacterium]